MRYKRFILFCSVLMALHGQAQVNLQTGSATFSLPMFQWQDNKSRLNGLVALSYSSGSGLKVNDVASNVGQGWNIIAGGVITRMQAGEPDDQYPFEGTGSGDLRKYPAGLLYTTRPAVNGYPESIRKYPIYKRMNQVYSQHNIVAADKQVDQFSYQFNGKSGIFILDPANIGTTQSLGDTKLKISFALDATLINQGIRTRITSFTIQDVDGLIYRFQKQGLTKILRSGYCDGSLTTELVQPKFDGGGVYNMKGFDDGIYNPYVIGSWYLSEVEDPFTHRKITLSYTNRTLSSTAGADISYNLEKDYSLISNKTSITESPDIAVITYPDGHTATFNYGANRADLNGAKVLSSISFNYSGRPLSQYIFSTSYFILNRYGTPITDYQKRVARLCLKSVQKIGVDLKEDSPPYIFDYFMGSSIAGDFVPPSFFYAKDIWGYYNAGNSKGYNNEAIPLNTTVNQLSNSQLRGLCFRRTGSSGIQMNANPGYAKNGLLRQIIYPTGGTLSYQYAQNVGVIGSTINVGGVHVSQSNSTDGGGSNDCANPLSTSYNYVLSDGTSSSLWGLELPVNESVTYTHYQPEKREYHWSLSCPIGGCCFWNFQYPGILSQQSAISLTGMQQFMNAISPVLGIISIVTTIMDVATLIGASAPGFGTIAAVVIDVIGGLVQLFVTCFGSQSRDYTSTIYYNSDMNGIAPLPTQFKRVEVIENPGTIGKTVHEFTSDADYPVWSPPGNNPTFASKQRFAPWAYGLPKKVTVLNSAGQKVTETENVFSFSTTYPMDFHCDVPNAPLWQRMHYDRKLLLQRALNVMSAKSLVKKYTSQRNTDWANPAFYDDPTSYKTTSNSDMLVDRFDMYTGRAEVDFSYERTYKSGDPTNFMETLTQYLYNDENYEIASIKKTGSDGKISRKNIYYSVDYVKPHGICYTDMSASATTNAQMVALVNQNIISEIVETSSYEDNYFVGDQATLYTTLGTGEVKPWKVLQARVQSPQASMPTIWFPDYYHGTNNMPPPLLNPANPDYAVYKLTTTNFYVTNGNFVGMIDEGGRQVANIYDYSDKFIAATVINAHPTLDKSCEASFEASNFGGWTLSPTPGVYVNSGITGSRSLALTGKTMTTTLNSAKLYKVTFWATTTGTAVSGGTLVKSGPTYNGFTYYEYNLAASATSVSVSGSTTIDELRVYPRNSLMNSTTYDPLIGKTSECDDNNRITYYEYDNLGRLRFIKDEKKNIVKMYEYNNVSAAKQKGCPGSYSNLMISEVFTTTNCGAGYIGGPVNFTVPANMFTSTLSQADADAQAEAYLIANGQTYANTASNKICYQIYWNGSQQQTFYSEDCPPGYVGGAVVYSVPANRYFSFTSVADANARALAEIAANGQAYANSDAHRLCVVSNDPDYHWHDGDPRYCSSVNGQPPHLFVLGRDENPNSPTYNQTQWMDIGPSDECPAGTYYNVVRDVVFYKTDCPSGIGLPYTFHVNPGVYSSTVSQAAADQLATNYITANGQAAANANGSCCIPTFAFASGISSVTSGITLSGTSTINFNWVFTHTGTTSLTLGTISPACARPTSTRTIPRYIGSTLYQIVINTSGVVQLLWVSGPYPTATQYGISGTYDLFANAFYSAEKSGPFIKQCPVGQTGSTVIYTVPSYSYSSLVNQATADQLAQNAVDANGLAYANATGTCTPTTITCPFSQASGITWYSGTMTNTGTVVNFSLVFNSPSANYLGAGIGYISSPTCRPSVNRTVTVTDGSNSSRIWNVTVTSGGVVSISKVSGPVVPLGSMITLVGSYNL